MKVRESGMPDEATWASFFEPAAALEKLGLGPSCKNVVDFGCGYGTFTIPAAKIASGQVYGLDLDGSMLEITARNAGEAGVSNVSLISRDFIEHGSGLAPQSADFVMLFNILHARERSDLLREAHRVLRAGGRLAIMHWNHESATPRGPSMEIRPKPRELRDAAERAGFTCTTSEPIDLPPWHYGWSFIRAPQASQYERVTNKNVIR